MHLAQVAVVARRAIIIAGALIVLYLIYAFGIKPVALQAYYAMFPVKDEATPVYGTLAKLEFVQAPLLTTTSTYELNTRTGRLPSLPAKAKVYKYKPTMFQFEAGKNAQTDAALLGYTDEDLITDLKGDVYKWRNNITKGTLEINNSSRVIKLSTPLRGLGKYFGIGSINKQNAEQMARELFIDLRRFNDDLYPVGTGVVILGKFSGEDVEKTDFASEAQFARVDFFRKVENFQILGPDPKKGLLSVVIRKVVPENPYLNYSNMQAYFWDISTNTKATYPLIPVQYAWDEVKKGKGVVVHAAEKGYNPFKPYNPIKANKIIINNIYLAYYDDYKVQTHLQPIFVFEGNYIDTGDKGGTIVIYYPAIHGQFIK